MKKKFLTFALMICFIIPCAFLFAACGETKEYVEISCEDSSFVSFSGTDGSVEKGTNASCDIYLSDEYDLNTLKVFANGQEVAWTQKADYVNDGIIQRQQEHIGSVALSNVQEDTILSATCGYKNIKISLTLKDGATNTEVLNDFRVYGKNETLLESAQSSTVFETPYNQILNGYQVLRLECEKHIGYYEFFDEKQVGDTWVPGVIETDGYRLTTNPQTGLKSYNIITDIINNGGYLPEAIPIEIDPDDLTLNSEIIIENGAGSIVSLSRDKFASDDVGATITIADIAGANYENAELKINGKTVIEKGDMVNRKTYSINSLPIIYNTEYEDNYIITLEGLDLSGVNGLYSIKYIDNGTDATFGTWNNPYYVGGNVRYLEASAPTTDTITINDWNSVVNTITISSSEGEVTIDLTSDVVGGVFSKNGYAGTVESGCITITSCPFTNDVAYTFEINKQ